MIRDDFEDAWEDLYPTLRGRGNFKNLVGLRFGRLSPQERVGADKHGSAIWRCLCDCGNYKEVARRDLRTRGVRSCGCLRAETKKKKRP